MARRGEGLIVILRVSNLKKLRSELITMVVKKETERKIYEKVRWIQNVKLKHGDEHILDIIYRINERERKIKRSRVASDV